MATVMIDLKRLGDVKAPAGFAERVLAQAGMADSYAVFETVLGPVYVAWNRLGVSAAMRSKSAAEFEDWFRSDVGRKLVRVDPPADLGRKIEDQLSGKRRLRFDLRGLTVFSQDVLHKTLGAMASKLPCMYCKACPVTQLFGAPVTTRTSRLSWPANTCDQTLRSRSVSRAQSW